MGAASPLGSAAETRRLISPRAAPSITLASAQHRPALRPLAFTHLGHMHPPNPTLAAPPIKVICKTNNTTVTYVSSHIHYMLTELLKNSLRAVVDHHIESSAGNLPTVLVVLVRGEEDITIRVSDEGGGIPRSQMNNMFSFLHSTAPSALDSPGSSARDRGHVQAGQMRATSQNTPVLAGWGVGLPLSRTYARYFGGDLDIKSMDGYGTDAYLHLNILGDGCENLPSKVPPLPFCVVSFR
jgi:pyruvate dehydrogenase kinase 2/3/4